VSRVWVELHYSLLQPPLRPTNVGCGVCSSCVSGFAALERLSSFLFVSDFSVLFYFVLIRSFIFRSGGVRWVSWGWSWSWSWGAAGVCVDDSLPASSDLVLSFGKLELLRRGGTAREAVECTSAYLCQYSALRMYDP
jgi:hypothetical protein